MTSMECVQFSGPSISFVYVPPPFSHTPDLGRPISNDPLPPSSRPPNQLNENQVKENIIQG